MSQEVFPSFPGLEFPASRRTKWRTTVRETPSNREYRSTDITFPRYVWKWSYEFLRYKPAQDLLEWAELDGFFNRRHGRLDDFLLRDPDDEYTEDQVFAVGDGTTTKYSLVREFGGFVMPIGRHQTITMRLDYWGGAAVLVRTSATNRWTQSSAINSGDWGKVGGSVTASAHEAPNGTDTGDRFTVSTANSRHYFSQFTSDLAAGSTFTVSGHFKQISGAGWIRIRAGNQAETVHVLQSFNVNNGTAGAAVIETGDCYRVDSGIYQADNGWYRVWLTVNMGDSSTDLGARFFLVEEEDGATSYTGNGTDAIAVWGMQCEVGVEPSVYIPTSSVPVTATHWTANDYGTVTFADPPSVGFRYSWTGFFWWRVRFMSDELDCAKFAQGFYSAKGVEMITVLAE